MTLFPAVCELWDCTLKSFYVLLSLPSGSFLACIYYLLFSWYSSELFCRSLAFFSSAAPSFLILYTGNSSHLGFLECLIYLSSRRAMRSQWSPPTLACSLATFSRQCAGTIIALILFVSASEFVALPDVQYIDNWYSICFLQYFNCFRKDGKYGPVATSVSESGLQKLKGFIFESISYSSLINKSSFTHWFDSVIVLLIDSFIHSTFMCSYKQYLYVLDTAPRPGNSSMDPAHGEFICYERKQTH